MKFRANLVSTSMFSIASDTECNSIEINELAHERVRIRFKDHLDIVAEAEYENIRDAIMSLHDMYNEDADRFEVNSEV